MAQHRQSTILLKLYKDMKVCIRQLFLNKGLRLSNIQQCSKWMVSYLWCREFGKLVLTSYPCCLCKYRVNQRKEQILHQLEKMDQTHLRQLGSCKSNKEFCLRLQQIEHGQIEHHNPVDVCSSPKSIQSQCVL